MEVYGTIITCPKCDSEDIEELEKREHNNFARNQRNFWAGISLRCSCKQCGKRFNEEFHLQRQTVEPPKNL